MWAFILIINLHCKMLSIYIFQTYVKLASVTMLNIVAFSSLISLPIEPFNFTSLTLSGDSKINNDQQNPLGNEFNKLFLLPVNN